MVSGTFAPEFLALPEEVLTTTMIHHQHYFPVVSPDGTADAGVPGRHQHGGGQAPTTIAKNAERVLTARLRDARFFFEADRETEPGEPGARAGLHPVSQAHRQLPAPRRDASAELAGVDRGRGCSACRRARALAAPAGLLAKTDLTTHMVRELTELQGTMGGIYAREEGLPEQVWRAIGFHYLPVGVEADAPPSREALGERARPRGRAWRWPTSSTPWSACLRRASGRPGRATRSACGGRRTGWLRILVDLPELTGLEAPLRLPDLLARARAGLSAHAEAGVTLPAETRAERSDLGGVPRRPLRYLFQQRGFGYDEVNAIAGSSRGLADNVLDARRRLEALRAVRGSADFEALAVAFKRVKNLARELAGGPAEPLRPADDAGRGGVAVGVPRARRGHPPRGRRAATTPRRSGSRRVSGPVVDRFFVDVFVMVDDERCAGQRLTLVWRLHELLLELADISEIVPRNASTS